MVAIAGPEVPRSEAGRPQSVGQMVPFRRATTRRSQINVVSTGTVTASQQNIQETIEGTGYMTGIVIEVDITTAGNALDVAYQEDAPWAAIASIILSDTTGESFNLTGFDAYLLNKYGGWYTHGTLESGSSDANIYSLTSGTGATGGSLKFFLRVPTAINNRNFLGALGNQDRALKYQLRTDFAASGNIYSTAPTTAGALTINRYYESLTVPPPTNSHGVQQEIMPQKFGVHHFATRTVAEAPPQGGTTVNHQLRRLNNTIRTIILVFRENGSRASAEANMPTRISLKLGDMLVLEDTTAYRRKVMYERFGYDADDGVLVYDWLTDVMHQAGSEFGLDYLWTGGLVNAELQITYPSGFGSTNNSLVIITSDLIIPDGVDFYAPDSA